MSEPDALFDDALRRLQEQADVVKEVLRRFKSHDALIGAARPAADLLDNLLSRVRGFEFWEEHPYAAGIARDLRAALSAAGEKS